MTEMEMVRDLRRVVASVAGKAGGNREKVKAEIRAELVSTVLDGQGKVRETSIADIMDVVGTRNANKLTLNGGRIKDAANNDADLSHNAPV